MVKGHISRRNSHLKKDDSEDAHGLIVDLTEKYKGLSYEEYQEMLEKDRIDNDYRTKYLAKTTDV